MLIKLYKSVNELGLNLDFKDFIILIPARIGSTRLNEKLLIEVNGTPIIMHVFQSAKKADLNIPILVATDNEKILNIVNKNGGKAIMTKSTHESGSDRIHEALNKFDPIRRFKKIIHLQGDLPNVSKKLISNLAKIILNQKCIATPIVKASEEEVNDPNVVKCVASFQHENPKIDDVGRALYFSRSKVPWGSENIWHHLGIYAWDREILDKFIQLGSSTLEKSEKLEQLRALEANIEIKILLTNEKPIGIDTIEDLKLFKNSFKK